MPEHAISAIGPESGELLARGERHHRALAELPEYELIELRFGPDFEGVDLHSHAGHVDSFYVLAGQVEFVLGDEVVRAGPGSFVAVPAGVTHGFRVVGDAELRMLNIHAPNAGFIGRLRGE
jgi:mannose-6-phosphate isomerase-like protein (cupin superfamily)